MEYCHAIVYGMDFDLQTSSYASGDQIFLGLREKEKRGVGTSLQLA